MAAEPSIGRASGVQARPAAPEAELTRELYERHAHRIFTYCLHQLGSREEAEDATQTTFMNAFRGLKRGVVPELESAWLFKIAGNVILTRRRSSSRRRRVETPGDLDAIQDLLPSRERDADELIRLDDALSAMPDQQRRALLLREWQGLSYREIGEELGLSQAAVETLLFRARRSLAKGLTDPEGSRRAAGLRGGLDLGSLLAGLKGLLGGGVAIKAVATAAVVAGSAVVATDPVLHHRAPSPLPAPVAAAQTRAKAPAHVAPAVVSAAPLTRESTLPVRVAVSAPVHRVPARPRTTRPVVPAAVRAQPERTAPAPLALSETPVPAVERKRPAPGRQAHAGKEPKPARGNGHRQQRHGHGHGHGHGRGHRDASVPAAPSAPQAPAAAAPRPAHGSAGHGHAHGRGNGNRLESAKPTVVAPPASVLPEPGPPPPETAAAETTSLHGARADGRSSHGDGHGKQG